LLVVMRLKIQEQRELNFVSRIIQCPLAIGNCPMSVGLGGGDDAYNLKVTRYTYVEEADNAPSMRRV
jgi:hypothetical protein